MKTTPLLTLCALLGTLATCSHLSPPADFDLPQVYGKWYTIGLATNAPWLATHKESLKMLTTMVHQTATGDVNSTYSMLRPNGKCWRMSHVIQKTGTPGRFSFHTHHNDQDMEYEVSVVDVVYDSYGMLHTIQTKPAVSSPYTLCEFHSRTPEVSTDLQDKFKQFALDVGVLRHNILFLPMNGEC